MKRSSTVGLAALSLVMTMTTEVRGLDLPSAFEQEEIICGLQDPAAMAFAPDGRLFIAERIEGRLLVAHQNAETGEWLANTEPFYSFDIPVDADGDPERHNSSGLRGFTFDPDFAQNGYVYCFYMKHEPRHNRIVRIEASAVDPDVAAPGELLLLDLPFNGTESSGSHNGSAMEFGPDGTLYVTTGDGWNGGDDVQSLSTWTGKLLRIQPGGGIPTDNPFFDQAAGDFRAIYALGLRNPFSMSRHPVTQQLYVNDVVDGGNKANVYEVSAAANYGQDGYGGIGIETNPWAIAGVGGTASSVISGGAWYPECGPFPAAYSGVYFTSLFGRNFSSVGSMTTIASDRDTTVSEFMTNAGYGDPGGDLKPMAVRVGPDGLVYYLASSYEADSGRVFVVRPVNTADLDGDSVVGFSDLLEVLTSWGPCAPCDADLDCDGQVGFTDVLVVLSRWG